MFQVAPFIIDQVEHDLSLCLWLVTFSNGTLQPNQLNPRVTLETDGLNYSLRFLLDAALIPLIEDLFKELAMIEACNKVRKEKRGKCDTILSGKRDTSLTAKMSMKIARAQSYHVPIALMDGA